MAKIIKTPDYWKKELYQPLVEMKTAYGNYVQVPKIFTDAWWAINLAKEINEKEGRNPLDFLNPDAFPYYDIELVFYEIYD